MTLIDEAPDRTGAKPRRPRVVWVFGALALLILLIGLTGGSYQGKLADVQKNDNSSFLPDSADSTKVADEQQKFSTIQSIPGFIVYQRQGGLTDADKAAIQSDIQKFKTIKGVSADEVATRAQLNANGDTAAVSVPLVAKQNGKSVQGPDLVDAEKAIVKAAKDGAPAGLVVHSAGAGGILVAFIDAFEGLDGQLLLAAGLVVIFILLFVYRSPILWAYPLICAVLALGAASIVIYTLAKHDVITLNGQSQGILSVLVIGAGTDYALLLVSRYREELHEYDSRLEAMIAAWKGAAPPIIASALTVILGLICLTFAELNSTAGLGPVCAIGIFCTVVVMLTVLPALLVVSGRWIFWPKRPRVDHRTDILEVHGVWGRFSKSLAVHYRRAWLGAGLVLVACLIGIVTLKTDGLPTEKGFTNKPEAITGQQIYNKNFDKGAGAPAVILTAADKADAV
jgi:RND superfamily putative drug exporter